MLRSHEPPAFEVVRPAARSRLLLVCDHASRRIPEALEQLGLPTSALETHIGWDIGAAAVARSLSERLGATLILSGYSRLVIDCNRPTSVPGSIPATTCGTAVPGNEGLGEAARTARIETFFRPYHDAIAALLDERTSATSAPVLLSIHSFTPALFGHKRPWHIGTLYGRDARLAHRFRDALRRDSLIHVGDNEPYSASDATDYTIPVHGEGRGLLHTALELRQDGIADSAGAAAWAERIAAIYGEIERAGL